MTNSTSLQIFGKLPPYKLVCGFLGDETVERLLQYMQINEHAFMPTKVGPTGNSKIDASVRISRVLSDLGPWREDLEKKFKSVLNNFAHEFGMSDIDITCMEIEIVAHGDGAFYKRHIDTSITQQNARSDRVLTGVYYFHHLPKEHSGGALRLYSIHPVEQGGKFIDIIPEQDSLLLFPSWAPHEVRPISCPSGAFIHSRFAINCWYRKRRKITAFQTPRQEAPARLSTNPLVDVAKCKDIDSAYLEINSYTAASGFTCKIFRDDEVGYAAALRLLNRSECVAADALGASPDEIHSLWEAGLLVSADSPVELFAPTAFAISPDFYIENGFTLIPDCLTPAARGAIVAYYRKQIADSAMRRGDRLSDRYFLHNDPAGRILQRALREAVERIVGGPIKSTYTYASLYCGGAALPVHTDRAQCKYTMSVLLDLDPAPDDGLSPWAIQVYARPDAPPVECRQSVGGALLFRGYEIPHSRGTLPSDHTCWVLLLHYVDADFTGSLV